MMSGKQKLMKQRHQATPNEYNIDKSYSLWLKLCVKGNQNFQISSPIQKEKTTLPLQTLDSVVTGVAGKKELGVSVKLYFLHCKQLGPFLPS